MTTTLAPTSTATGDDDQRQALSAPVRDPLWLLARQWQTAAFTARDAGTPTHVSVAFTVAPLAIDGVSASGPLEPPIEAEPDPPIEGLDTAARVRGAVELLRRVGEAGVAAAGVEALRAAWASVHPLRAAEPGSTVGIAAARLPDPAALFHILAQSLAVDGQGSFPAALDLTAAGAQLLDAQTGLRGWYAWMAGQLAAPGAATDPQPPAWDPQRLEYHFAATSATSVGALTLRADDYDGHGIDWYSFDAANGPTAAAPTVAVSAAVRAAPVLYPGMPRPRFWELEDGDVNLDLLRDGSDPAHAVLAAFAYAYANDWFVIALPDCDPGVVAVTSVSVADSFGGDPITVPAVADVDGGSGPWRLWDLTGDTAAARGARLLAPVSPAPLQGPLIEEALVARDELANLAWLIELTTRDQDGATVDRYRRWLSLRPPSDPSFRPADRILAGQTYRLGTPLPDYWYPLEQADGVDRAALLQFIAAPLSATNVADTGVRGVIVDTDPGGTLADEEASADGTQLVRRDRLVRTAAGPRVWRARVKDPGTGEAASGLRFDVLE